MVDMKYLLEKNNSDILQAKIQSRHVSSKSYYLWIQYDSADTEDPVTLWYCQCRSGARLVGCCAHVSSVLWYIGIKRHETPLTNKIIPNNVIDCRESTD